MDFQTFEDVLDHLDRLGLFHMDFELNRMVRALSALGLSEQTPFVVVQVVGTNGKGSTSTFLASLAQAHGLKTGLYTSPHFVTPRERIRINGQMLDAALWPALATRVMQAAPDLTYFEFLTALGLLAFADAGVDLVVLEAGLGGRYDATTAMPARVVCFTPISLDHEAVLGSTLTAIAADKAQAMRPGVPAFTAPQEAEALHVLRRTAQEKNVVLHELSLSGQLDAPETPVTPVASEDTPRLLEPLGLPGPHQQINARLALTVWEYLTVMYGWPLYPEGVQEGLASARLPGRLQSLYLPCLPNGTACAPEGTEPFPLLLDGAHNPHGLRALEIALATAHIKPRAIVFSCLADKNIGEMLPILCRLAGEVPILVPTIQDNERALLAPELAARIQPLRGNGQCTIPVQRLSLALKEAALLGNLQSPGAPSDSTPDTHAPKHEHRPVLLCGSLYLLGEFFTLYPCALESAYMEPHQPEIIA